MTCEAKYFVYALVDPVNKYPFYVGKGCGDRPYKHLDGTDVCNKRKVDYINNLRNLGCEPTVEIIKDNMFEKDAYDFETNIIRFMRENKYFPFITNKTGVKQPPSRKGVKWTPEAIAKRSATLKKNIQAGKTVKVVTDEQKSKIAKKLTGRKLTEEHKRNIAKVQTEKRFEIQDVELLREEYLVQNFSRKSLAKKYGCSEVVLKRILSENNIRKWKRN